MLFNKLIQSSSGKKANRFRRRLASAFAAALAVTLALSAPLTAAAGSIDPVFYSAAYSDVREVYGTSAERLQQHYDMFGENEGRSANLQEAIRKKDVPALIAYYLSVNGETYRAKAQAGDNNFFNADNYLAAYPDVAAAVGNDKTAALEHYLTCGAIEGRDSGTVFDPVMAIAAHPEMLQSLVKTENGTDVADDPAKNAAADTVASANDVTADFSPEMIFNTWTAATGTSDTAIWRFVLSKEGIVISAKAPQSQPSAAAAGGASTESAAGSSGSSSQPAITTQETLTLMLYLCGSDLESKEGNTGATTAILKVLLGLYNNPNCKAVVLAGGADTWKNNYLNNLIGGGKEARVNGLNKSALFYIDSDAVNAAVDQLIASDDRFSSVQEIYNYVNTYNAEDSITDILITADTLKLSGSVSAVKIGSAENFEKLLKGTLTENPDYTADHYALSIWNHGGGSTGGICQPDDGSGLLSLEMINTGLKDTGVYLDLLSFDACMMGSAEIAAYLKDYYGFMCASEDLTTGDVNYYELLRTAKSSLGSADLAFDLACTVYNDRAKNFHGLDTSMATEAIFCNTYVQPAVDSLESLATDLLELIGSGDGNGSPADEKGMMIYKALKSAYLKSQHLGADKNRYANNSFVDYKDFMNQLETELNAVLTKVTADTESTDERTTAFTEKLRAVLDTETGSLSAARKAADSSVYANAYNYHGLDIFYSDGVNETKTNETFWKNYKGNSFSGSSIFFPYLWNIRDSEPGTAYEKEVIQTYKNTLSVYQKTYQSLGLEKYVQLINRYSDEYLLSDAEVTRLANLKQELMNGTKNTASENGETAAVAGYKDILSVSYKADDKVLQLKVNDYSTAEGAAPRSEYSSGDAYIDLIETIDAMRVYITRTVSATLYSQTTHTNGTDSELDDTSDDTKTEGSSFTLNIIVGSSRINYENVSGTQAAVNVFTSSLTDAAVSYVNGQSQASASEGEGTGSKTITDWIMSSDLEDYSDTKLYAVSQISSSAQKSNVDDYLTFRGTCSVGESKTAVGRLTDHEVYHIFQKTADGTGYAYIGSVQADASDKTQAIQYSKVENVTSISFYHYMEDTSTHKLVYAETYWMQSTMDPDCSWDRIDSSVVSITGAASFKVSEDSTITLQNSTMSSVNQGKTDNNGYYFAVSQSSNLYTGQYVVDELLKENSYDSNGELYSSLSAPAAKTDSDTGSETTKAAAADGSGNDEQGEEADEAVEEGMDALQTVSAQNGEMLTEAGESGAAAATSVAAVNEMTAETSETTEETVEGSMAAAS